MNFWAAYFITTIILWSVVMLVIFLNTRDRETKQQNIIYEISNTIIGFVVFLLTVIIFMLKL